MTAQIDGASGDPAPSPGLPLRAQLPWLPLFFVTVLAALVIAMGEISRLSGSVLDARSQVWTFGELMGPSAWVARPGWLAQFGAETIRPRALHTYLLLDVAFIVGYFFGLMEIIWRRYANGTRNALMVAVAGLAVVDGVEDALAWGSATQAVTADQATVLALVTSLKWVLAAISVPAAAYGVLTINRQPISANVRLLYEVLRKHRLTLLPVLAIAIVAIAPGADILDQVPDIERRWADGRRNFWFEGVPGFAALVILAFGLLLLGRARTHLAARTLTGVEAPRLVGVPGPGTTPVTTPPPLHYWVIGPAGVAAVGVVLALFGADVQWLRLAAFCALPLAIAGVSGLYRRRRRRGGSRLWVDREPVPWTRGQLELLLKTGDGLALAVLVLGALGAIRSLTAVVLLEAVPGSVRAPYAGMVLTAGWIGALLVWPLVAFVYSRLIVAFATRSTTMASRFARWLAPRYGESRPVMLQWFPRVAVAVSLVIFVALGMWPSTFGQLGVLFVFVMSIAALTGIVSGAALVVQRFAPVEVFQRIHLRSTPVVTLLLVAVVFAGEVTSRTPIHALRSEPATRPAQPTLVRPGLVDTVAPWADAQVAAGCARPVAQAPDLEAVPMVMLAAQGGGIRAAYWTVQTTQRLAADPCARQATLFSSGVSGGAVGLAVARYNADPTPVVKQMSNSRALSYGLIGLFIRDFTYAATGIPLPDLERSDPMAWVDRSGLMEDAWNESAAVQFGWRDRAFAGEPGDPTQQRQPTVGSVILNSMAVGNACRVWVSEVKLRSVEESVADGGDGKVDCDQPGVPGVRSIDLLSAYGAEGSGEPTPGRHNGCVYGLTTATAAMLAARFPYVTPSGRIGECSRARGTAPSDQLVDGGYLENTGLGTINDLADLWLPAVQAWNDQQRVAAEQTPGSRRKVIVPLVVYLNNDSGNDRRAPQRDITSEAAVPPLARLRAYSGAVADQTTIQRSMDAVDPVRVCGPGDADCQLALGSVHRRVFMVYPGTSPQIAAPMGWVLSESSQRSMDSAMDQQAAYRCDLDPYSAQVNNVVCDRGLGSFGDLMDTLAR